MPHVGPENIEALKDNRPFIMRAELEHSASFLQAVAVPSIIDMLGFSGGGGAPAYAFKVDTQFTDRRKVLFLSTMPNTDFYVPPGHISLGVVQSMGVLLAHFMIDGEGIVDDYEKQATEAGAVVVDMLDYQVPEVLRQKILPSRLAQVVQEQT